MEAVYGLFPSPSPPFSSPYPLLPSLSISLILSIPHLSLGDARAPLATPVLLTVEIQIPSGGNKVRLFSWHDRNRFAYWKQRLVCLPAHVRVGFFVKGKDLGALMTGRAREFGMS